MKLLSCLIVGLGLLVLSSASAEKSPILKKETQEVFDAFSNKDIAQIYNFCEDKVAAMTCSQLVTFHGTKSFIYNFASLERQVGATVYYLEKDNGRFKNVLDEIFDGVAGVDKAFDYNADIEVVFDEDGLPTAKNVRVVRHGTTKYSISDLMINRNGIRYNGFMYDMEDPSYKLPLDLRYTRVGLPIIDPSFELPIVKQIRKLFSAE